MSDHDLDVGRLLESAERLGLLPVPAHGVCARELPTGAVVLAFDLGPAERSEGGDPLAKLTPGQRRIALLALDGCGDDEIARRLDLSRHTVSNQLRRGYARLGVNSRSELAALVCRRRRRAAQ